MDDDEQCGPYHSGCNCIYECRDCFGRLEEDVMISDSGHESVDYICLDCLAIWHRADVRPAGSGMMRKAEWQKLARWKAWATRR